MTLLAGLEIVFERSHHIMVGDLGGTNLHIGHVAVRACGARIGVDAVAGEELVFGMPDVPYLKSGDVLLPLTMGRVGTDYLYDILDGNVALPAPLPREEYICGFHVFILGDDISDVALGTNQAPGFLAGYLVGVLSHGLQGIHESPAGEPQSHVPVFMAVHAGSAEFSSFGRDLGAHLGVRIAEIGGPEFAFELRDIGRFTREAGASRLRAGLVDFDLVRHHVVMPARFVVLDTEPPSVEQQRHEGILTELVVVCVLRVEVVLVLCFTDRPRVFRLHPGIIFEGIGFTPVGGIHLAVRDSRRFHGFGLLLRTAADKKNGYGNTRYQQENKKPFPVHVKSPLFYIGFQ